MQKVFWIDLFCGAGGTTTGINMSNVFSEVVACVNHDPSSIKNHSLNYPDCIHFTEDIRDFKVVEKLIKIVEKLRKDFPSCKINLWASLECTNHSNAKGGLAKNADSRTLANHLFMYLDALDIDYLYIENVREFMQWGPLNNEGRPVKERMGEDYNKWVNSLKKRGFEYDYRLINAADHGVPTTRIRYFGQFASKGLPISWPVATHSKTGGVLKEWLPIKDVLDMEAPAKSIFGRKKDLSERTLERVLKGLKKFSKDPVSFFTYYGNSSSFGGESPCPTLTTKDRVAVINHVFIDKQYGTGVCSSIDNPASTLTAVPKLGVVTVSKFLMQHHFDNPGYSIENPSPTLIASMNKKPLYVVDSIYNPVPVKILSTDSPFTKLIKEFMIDNGIADITLRMLTVREMLDIQGFPKSFKLKGTQASMKKQIGNSVAPIVAQRLAESNYHSLASMSS